MARTILDIRAGLIEELHGLQIEVDALQAELKDRCATIDTLDQAISVLTEGMATPRPEMPDAITDDVGDSEGQDGGNPFAYETVEFFCYEALAQSRAMRAGVEIWRDVRKMTTSVIGRDTVRQALYNHPDVFFLVKQGWFRLRGQ